MDKYLRTKWEMKLNKLLNDIENGKVCCIIVKDKRNTYKNK